MTTQYTSILKLALPVQGELSGTWGDVVNDNITSMVEEAVAGRAVVNTWTTNSHVLTTADGTTSESRCAMLEFTDTGTALTGAATVVCPSASKLYVCKNDSGQQVTVKTAAGTGVAIPDGQTMFVFCDGTNVEQCTTNFNSLSFNDYTLNFGGAVTTAGAFTTSGAYALTLTTTGATNVTLPTTGTLATLDGTETLTNKTLTSPTVSSPTLTGTISATDLTISGNTTIGDDPSDTLTVNSTITSNLIFTDDTYDIGAVGATRPRNLYLSGNATIGGTVTLSGGVDVTGALGVDGDFDVNTDKFTVTSATGNTAVAGTLGVTGITTATGGLNVDTIGEITAAGGVTIDGVLLKDSQVNTDQINEKTAGVGVTIDSVLLKDDVVNASDIETSTISANDGTAAGSIANSTGAVTITSFISNSVDIGGGAIDDTTIGGTTPNSGAFTTLSASGDLTVDTNTLYVDSTNNRVGIGTTSPSYELSVGANNNGIYSDADGMYVVQNTSNLDVLSLQSKGIVEYRSDDQNNTVETGHIFYTDGSEAARINNSGNVGIGVSVPTSKLHVRPVDETNFRVFEESTNLVLASETNNGRDSNRGMDLESSTLRAVISGTTQLTVNSSGLNIGGTFTAPSQPAFHAYNGASDDNVTGNGTVATVDFNNESFDQGSNFSADTFTAPVDGRYQLNTTVRLDDMSGNGGVDSVELTIVTSNGSYQFSRSVNAFAEHFHLSVLADMDASDTAYVTIKATGQTSDTTDVSGGSNNTYFSGFLAC